MKAILLSLAFLSLPLWAADDSETKVFIDLPKISVPEKKTTKKAAPKKISLPDADYARHVVEVINTAAPGWNQCLQASVSKDFSLGFEIDSNGHAELTQFPKELGDCLSPEIKKLKFKTHKFSEALRVRLPFQIGASFHRKDQAHEA